MEPSGFWSLFAETGEPMGWLLCRAEERAARSAQDTAPEKPAPPESATPPKL